MADATKSTRDSKATSESATDVEQGRTIVAVALNTFDLPSTDNEVRKYRGRQAIAGQIVRLSEDEFKKYKRLRLVAAIDDGDLPTNVTGFKPEGESKIDRYIVGRDGGWFDVVGLDGSLVNGSPIRGHAAASTADMANMHMSPSRA